MNIAAPEPDAGSLELSAGLREQIAARIRLAGGSIGFDEYMELALYTPGLGYYSNGSLPFGAQGDFITAPETGSLFATSLAEPVSRVLASIADASVLEVGAGSAALAIGLMQSLEERAALPLRYLILERSETLRATQRRAIEDCIPHLLDRFEWLEAAPEPGFLGVVLANEVADALPVKRFAWLHGQVREFVVMEDGGELVEGERDADTGMRGYVGKLAANYAWPDAYHSEYCPSLKPWMQCLSACLSQGLLLLVDYGYVRAEYYSAQRSMGTFITHFRHRASDTPLKYPGLQDMTAFIDFTALAEAGVEAGLDLHGFASQANFLLGCGIDRLVGQLDPGDTHRFLRTSAEMKRLVLPSEMGERFKCMAFTRNLDMEIPGFGTNDLRSRL